MDEPSLLRRRGLQVRPLRGRARGRADLAWGRGRGFGGPGETEAEGGARSDLSLLPNCFSKVLAWWGRG